MSDTTTNSNNSTDDVGSHSLIEERVKRRERMEARQKAARLKKEQEKEQKDASAEEPQEAAGNVSTIDQSKVSSAVQFLTSPRIQSTPWESRIAFLRRKGLSDAEVEEASRRAKNIQSSGIKNDGDNNNINNSNNLNNNNMYQQQQPQAYPYPYPYPPPPMYAPPRPSAEAAAPIPTWRSSLVPALMSALFVGGGMLVAGAIQKVMGGKPSQEGNQQLQDEALERIQDSVDTLLDPIRTDLALMSNSLEEQGQQLTHLKDDHLSGIRSEISGVKSVLLAQQRRRNQLLQQQKLAAASSSQGTAAGLATHGAVSPTATTTTTNASTPSSSSSSSSSSAAEEKRPPAGGILTAADVIADLQRKQQQQQTQQAATNAPEKQAEAEPQQENLEEPLEDIPAQKSQQTATAASGMEQMVNQLRRGEIPTDIRTDIDDTPANPAAEVTVSNTQSPLKPWELRRLQKRQQQLKQQQQQQDES